MFHKTETNLLTLCLVFVLDEVRKRSLLLENSVHSHSLCFLLQEYSEWKKEATDISLPGVYIGLMDRLNAFSRVIVDSTQELCAMLVSSYIEKVKETCKNGEAL